MTCIAHLYFQWKGFEEGFWQGAWAGVFQVLALAIITGFVSFLYRRYRERVDARRELIDEIDQFTIRLYEPRKMYQLVVGDGHQPTGEAARPGMEDPRIARAIEGLVAATGRFRAVQVKLVALFGYHPNIFAHYLAIWRYLKEIRQRMQQRESLFFHHETEESVDAFYRLIDSFRYQIMTAKFVSSSPQMVQPPIDLLTRLRSKGQAIYEQFFSQPSRDSSDKGSRE